jgi:hypothetical protein
MRHQIGGQLADRDAIHHQPEMLRADMIAAHFETFSHGRGETNRMAAQALFDAMAGFMGELIHRLTPDGSAWQERHGGGLRSAGAAFHYLHPAHSAEASFFANLGKRLETLRESGGHHVGRNSGSVRTAQLS